MGSMTIQSAKQKALEHLERGEPNQAIACIRLAVAQMELPLQQRADIDLWPYLSRSRSQAEDAGNIRQWILDLPES